MGGIGGTGEGQREGNELEKKLVEIILQNYTQNLFHEAHSCPTVES